MLVHKHEEPDKAAEVWLVPEKIIKEKAAGALLIRSAPAAKTYNISMPCLPHPLRADDAAVIQKFKSYYYLVCACTYSVQAGGGGVIRIGHVE